MGVVLHRHIIIGPRRPNPSLQQAYGMSIFSFPNKGTWDSSGYPGNCSGEVYLALFRQCEPKTMVGIYSGSGTRGRKFLVRTECKRTCALPQ